MYGVTLERKGLNRFQRMKINNPKMYNFVIKGGHVVNGQWKPKNGLGLGYILDRIGVKY